MMIPRPEGFIVNELTGEYAEGEHTHLTLWKREWNTLDAIKTIASALGVSDDRFGYAGLKDRNAITTQRISAWRVPARALKQLRIKDLMISDVKEGLEKITLGSHQGNEFKITLLGVNKLRKPIKVPNLFGKQRFGGNAELGMKLLTKDWVGIIQSLNPKGSYERGVIKHYERSRNALTAIKKVPKQVRVLWVNAYQAKQWNENIDTSKKYQEFPAYEMIKEMPELGSFPGGKRRTIMEIKDYKQEKIKDGFRIGFKLSTGSYATTLIQHLIQ